MAKYNGRRLVINPNYQKLYDAIELALEAYEKRNTIYKNTPAENKALWVNLAREIRSIGYVSDIFQGLKKQGYSDVKAVQYLQENFARISNSRHRTFENGEPIPLGRPRKDVKKERAKADRYKTITEIKKSGFVGIRAISQLTYDDIRKLSLKESQKIAYYIQENIKKRDRNLKSKGYFNTPAQKNFKDKGGFIPNILTASANNLKSFIKRGNAFLNSESSTPRGNVSIRNRVVEKVYDATGVNLEKFNSNKSDYDLFWGAVNEAESSGLATKLGSEKYEILNVIDYYLQGNKLSPEDINLQNTLDAWITNRLAKEGLTFESMDKLRGYLRRTYTPIPEDEEDLEDYV